MSRHNIPAMITLAVFPVAAVGLSIYMLVSGSVQVPAVAGVVLLLGAGLLLTAIAGVLKYSRLEDWIFEQQDLMADAAHRLDMLTSRLDDAEARIGQPVEGLGEIRDELKDLRDGLRRLMQAQERPQAPAQPAIAAGTAAPSAAAAGTHAAGEHLELLLEPVIELATGATAHYRALLSLADDHGHSVAHADLMRKADAGGMRPALDAHLVKQVAPVLRRLRARNPGMRAFLPLGIATLGSGEETRRIAATLERDADIAGGVVFEFDHRGLGALDDDGIRNLAQLARLGASMSLAQVQVAGLDLSALRQLGVRYLTFPPNAADGGSGPTPAWREFVQYARVMQFQVVVSDVVTPQQATAATQVGRYGFGSFFAPPRKVRADAGAAAAPRRASAA